MIARNAALVCGRPRDRLPKIRSSPMVFPLFGPLGLRGLLQISCGSMWPSSKRSADSQVFHAAVDAPVAMYAREPVYTARSESLMASQTLSKILLRRAARRRRSPSIATVPASPTIFSDGRVHGAALAPWCPGRTLPDQFPLCAAGPFSGRADRCGCFCRRTVGGIQIRSDVALRLSRVNPFNHRRPHPACSTEGYPEMLSDQVLANAGIRCNDALATAQAIRPGRLTPSVRDS